MKPPPLLLRFVYGIPALILLAIALLAIWGLAELHARQRWLADDFQRAMVQNDELDQQFEARRRIVQALIDGRLRLPEAAAHVRQLIQERQDPAVRPPEITREMEENTCRALIEHVIGALRGSPQRAAVLERLEHELEQHLAEFNDRAKNRQSKMDTSAGQRSPLNSKQ